MLRCAFHPRRLADSAAAIANLLDELPDAYQASKGGGWSFLKACVDRHGEQWTGLHAQMDRLFCLGVAVGKVRWLTLRALWRTCSGGMPYLAID